MHAKGDLWRRDGVRSGGGLSETSDLLLLKRPSGVKMKRVLGLDGGVAPWTCFTEGLRAEKNRQKMSHAHPHQ